MGLTWGRPVPREHKIVMFGDNQSGKSAICRRLVTGEFMETTYTCAFEIETIRERHCQLNLWDIGGACRIKVLWRNYVGDADAFVFVLDSRAGTIEQYGDVLQEDWNRVLTFEGKEHVPILIFSNFSDHPQSRGLEEVKRAMGVTDKDFSKRPMKMVRSSAVSGEGLWEGIRWLHQAIHSH